MLRIPVGLTCLLAMPGLGVALYQVVMAMIEIDCDWPMFLGGAGLSSLVWFIFLKGDGLLSTLEHELTHMVIAILLLKRPVNLRATHREGGVVEWRGPAFGAYFVTLAPYFVPTLTVSLLLMGWLVNDALMPVYIGLIGVTAGYHFWSTLEETHASQPDLNQYPKWFNWSVILAGHLFFTGLTLSFVVSGGLRATGAYAGMWNFIRLTWDQNLKFYTGLIGS